MQGLYGDFGTMPMGALVPYLGEKRASGTLGLERAGTRKEVWLREGMIINASSNVPREYLGRFLINMGNITEEQFARAFKTQKETKVSFGRIVVMIGAVSEQEVRAALSLKFRETLLEAYEWEDGTFAFDPNTEPVQPEGIDMHIDLLEVHRESDVRRDAWDAIRASFPSGAVRLELVERNIPATPMPGTFNERLFANIKEGRSIDELILALNTTEFFLYQRVHALHRLGAVQVAGQGEAEGEADPLSSGSATLGDEASPADIVAHARAYLGAGNFRDAEALARKAHDLMANGESAELLGKAEAELTRELRGSLVDGAKVASLLVKPLELRALKMTAPERYLLSRMDGSRPVAAIVQLSPLRELDALKFIQRFIEEGLVRIS